MPEEGVIRANRDDEPLAGNVTRRPGSILLRPVATRLRAHLDTPLYRNGYMLILASGATSLLGFLFWAVAAHRYPAAVVGVDSAALSAMMFVSGMAQLGLSNVLVRYLPRAGSATGRLIARSYALAGGLTAVAAFGAAATSHLWSPRLSFLANDARWLSGFVVGATVWTIFRLQDNVITGLRSTHWVLIENVLFAAAKLVLVFALAAVMPFGGVFAAWNIPAVIVVVGTNILIFAVLVPRQLASATEEPLDPQRMLRFASGNYLGSLFATAATLLPPILVTSVRGARDTAYFVIPWTIMVGLTLVATGTTLSLTVEVALDESRLRDDFRRIMVHTIRLVLPAVVILFVAAPYVLSVLGRDYARAGTTLLRLLAIATLPKIVCELGVTLARIRHAGRETVIIQAAQCVPALALGLVLLPRVGIVGLGVAWLATQTAVAVWLMRGILRPVLRGGPGVEAGT